MAIHLHPNQKIIYNDKHRYRVVVCGRRFGKTILSIREMLDYAYHFPNSKVVYLAPTIKQARDIAWRQLRHEAQPLLVGQPNETRLELSIRASSGVSEIWLRGTENVESLRGQGINFLVVDEVASIKDWQTTWEEVLRPTLTDTEGTVMFIGTPKGYNHFFDLYSMQEKDTDFKSFKFTSYDNPYMKPEEIDKARSEMNEDAFEQEYLANFRKLVGMVYKEWDMDKQFTHVEYDPRLPLHVSFDFGVNDPTAIIWIQPMGGEFRVIDYYEAGESSVDHFASVINGKPYHQISLATGDPAGAARSITTGTSPIEEYRKHGIQIRSKGGIRIPDQIRITHKYIPSLFVSDKLPRFKDCMLGYRYPEKGSNVIDQSNEIPVHDEFSHAMRALEYYFTNVDGGVGTSTFEEKMKQFNKVDLFDNHGILRI